jgi:hypothetical protein
LLEEIASGFEFSESIEFFQSSRKHGLSASAWMHEIADLGSNFGQPVGDALLRLPKRKRAAARAARFL